MKNKFFAFNNETGICPAEIGICAVLLVVFLILKLTGVIAWPWVWVCAPLWIPVALGGLIIIFFAW